MSVSSQSLHQPKYFAIQTHKTPATGSEFTMYNLICTYHAVGLLAGRAAEVHVQSLRTALQPAVAMV